MLDLSNITLWATVGKNDPVYLERTLRVLRYCHGMAKWHQKVLFTVIPPPPHIVVEFMKVVQVPEVPMTPQWQIIVNKVIPEVLWRYDYTMAIHEDGFPTNWDLWEPEFLKYDWVGAPWWDNVCGSGGCALVSGLLMQGMTFALPWYDGLSNADEWVCRVQRQNLVEARVKFAPFDVGVRYCTEAEHNDRASFAFHGRVHCREKYLRAWEQLEAWEKEQGL